MNIDKTVSIYILVYRFVAKLIFENHKNQSKKIQRKHFIVCYTHIKVEMNCFDGICFGCKYVE